MVKDLFERMQDRHLVYPFWIDLLDDRRSAVWKRRIGQCFANPPPGANATPLASFPRSVLCLLSSHRQTWVANRAIRIANDKLTYRLFPRPTVKSIRSFDHSTQGSGRIGLPNNRVSYLNRIRYFPGLNE